MAFFNQIKAVLDKPFPVEETWLIYVRNNLWVAIFVILFLYLFKPFGMGNIESYRFLVCLGFGAITFLSTILFDLLCGAWLTQRRVPGKMTYFKWILNMLGVVLTISMGNFLFARYIFFGYVDWQFFPLMIQSTFLIGIFPIIAIGGLALLRQEQKYQHIANEINLNPPSSIGNNPAVEERILDIPISQIRYLEALQNYVKVGFVMEDGSFREKTERSTLKSILEQSDGESILRCHRSYLVNPKTIVSTSGNAQGLLLELRDCEKRVPVSRSFVAQFRKV